LEGGRLAKRIANCGSGVGSEKSPSGPRLIKRGQGVEFNVHPDKPSAVPQPETLTWGFKGGPRGWAGLERPSRGKIWFGKKKTETKTLLTLKKRRREPWAGIREQKNFLLDPQKMPQSS